MLNFLQLTTSLIIPFVIIFIPVFLISFFFLRKKIGKKIILIMAIVESAVIEFLTAVAAIYHVLSVSY